MIDSDSIDSLLSHAKQKHELRIHGDTNDDEEKTGVREGGSAKTWHQRPHADGEGGQLQAGEDGDHSRRSIVGARGAPVAHRRVPRRRRNRNHNLHSTQRTG